MMIRVIDTRASRMFFRFTWQLRQT